MAIVVSTCILHNIAILFYEKVPDIDRDQDYDVDIDLIINSKYLYNLYKTII